jgi:hypothetical protein
MSVVDDFGRFDARPLMLRVSCYPLRVDRVREADISRWMDELQKAGLIALYAVNGKQYLEMADFRQQIRAKESKYPSPDVAMQGTCVADAKQMQGTCVADAHLGGGGGGVVDEDDKNPTTPRASAHEEVPFAMFVDWTPSGHLTELARQAGLPLPGQEDFQSCIGEFIAYWLSQKRQRSQHEWDHALLKSLKADQERKKAKPPPAPRTSKPEKFDPVAYVNRNRISARSGNEPSEDSNIIDITPKRLA